MRCPKVGSACPGYREEQELLFHNQGPVSYATRRRKQRGKPEREAACGDNLSLSRSSKQYLSQVAFVDDVVKGNYKSMVTPMVQQGKKVDYFSR
jgi:hypothetical protein